MTKAAAGEVIKLHFNHKLRLQGFPFARLLRAPATRPARLVTGKTRRCNQGFELFSQLFLLRFIEAGGVANVMKQATVVIQTQQQRSDDLTL